MRWVILSTTVLLAGAGGVYWWQSLFDGDDAQNELVLYGNVDIRQVELAFNGQERIAELMVEEGDAVTEGQLLGRLKLERVRLNVQRAEAMLQRQREVVRRLENGTRPEEIRKARADVEAAEAKAKDARLTYERMETLAARDAVSPQKLDDAEAALQSARAQVKATQAALDLAIAGPREEDIAEAHARLEELEAELALANEDLDDARLHAPSDGVIRDRILEPGDMASPERPAFTLALTDPLWVRAYIGETDLGKIAPGMTATVTTDSYPDKKYEGWIGFVSPTAEFTPKQVQTPELRTRLVYQVRVFVRNPQNELRLGMPATVHIPVDQPQKKTGNQPTGERPPDDEPTENSTTNNEPAVAP